MGALLPRRMSTEPAPSSPESSDSRKRRSLLALSSVTRKPATAANAALREEVQQALAGAQAVDIVPNHSAEHTWVELLDRTNGNGLAARLRYESRHPKDALGRIPMPSRRASGPSCDAALL